MLKSYLFTFLCFSFLAAGAQSTAVYNITFPAFVASKDMDANVVEIDSNRLITQPNAIVSALPGVELLSYSYVFSSKGEIFKWSGMGSLQIQGVVGRLQTTPGILFIVIDHIRFKGNVRVVEWTYKVKFV